MKDMIKIKKIYIYIIVYKIYIIAYIKIEKSKQSIHALRDN